jgi:hypothetical protein
VTRADGRSGQGLGRGRAASRLLSERGAGVPVTRACRRRGAPRRACTHLGFQRFAAYRPVSSGSSAALGDDAELSRHRVTINPSGRAAARDRASRARNGDGAHRPDRRLEELGSPLPRHHRRGTPPNPDRPMRLRCGAERPPLPLSERTPSTWPAPATALRQLHREQSTLSLRNRTSLPRPDLACNADPIDRRCSDGLGQTKFCALAYATLSAR